MNVMNIKKQGDVVKQEGAESVSSKMTTSIPASMASSVNNSNSDSRASNAFEEKSESEIVCSNLTVESNQRSIDLMKISFQPKTRLQRSVMWNHIGVLKPKVLIGKKFCDLGCKIHYAAGKAVGATSSNGSPGNFWRTHFRHEHPEE